VADLDDAKAIAVGGSRGDRVSHSLSSTFQHSTEPLAPGFVTPMPVGRLHSYLCRAPHPSITNFVV
jgi:hypothetical protein